MEEIIEAAAPQPAIIKETGQPKKEEVMPKTLIISVNSWQVNPEYQAISIGQNAGYGTSAMRPVPKTYECQRFSQTDQDAHNVEIDL